MAASKYNFLAEPDNALVCGICLEVAEEPRQHETCGKLLCTECLEKYGRGRPCPNCREKIPQYFGDNKSKREIKALGVRCSHVDRGCKWEGTIGTLKQHVDTCEFALVPCPKKCGDGHKKVMRSDLDNHLKKDCPNREHSCQYCGEKGTHETIVKIHDKSCVKKILPCSNAECTQTMERQQINEHVRTQCPHTVIPCKYKSIGCMSQLKRRDMAAHEEDDKLHLHMSIDTVNTLQDKVQTLQDMFCTLQDTFHKLQDTFSTLQSVTLKNKPMTFAVPDYQKKEETNAVFTSRSFYTHPNGYHMEVKVNWSNLSVGVVGMNVPVMDVSVHILEGAYDNTPTLKWPFRGKVTIELLNQLTDKNHKAWVIDITNGCVGNKFKIHQAICFDNSFLSSLVDIDCIQREPYLVNDTLYFRVSAKVPDHRPWLQCTTNDY